jgi:hypothetical protein
MKVNLALLKKKKMFSKKDLAQLEKIGQPLENGWIMVAQKDWSEWFSKSPRTRPAKLRSYLLPGNAVAAAIRAVFGPVPCFSCNELREEMNKAGWEECWARREEFLAKMRTNAAKMGVKLSDRALVTVIETVLGRKKDA